MAPIPENQSPAYKAAKLAVIILSALIILAVIALVVGGITHMGRKSPAHGATAGFELPHGARIVEMQSQPGRLILRVRDAQGEEIDMIDTQDGHLVGQVKTTFANDHLHQ
jgi:hypothetical protein